MGEANSNSRQLTITKGSPMPELWQVWVAIYAAMVATGVLFLEVRRWVETKARLAIDIAQRMQTINIPGAGAGPYLLVTVSNRGQSPTTITHLALEEFPSWWARVRGKRAKAAVVIMPMLPGMTQHLPFFLEPGAQWQGAALQDQELEDWIASGHLYVAIYASHFRKPLYHWVKSGGQGAPPEDAEQQ